MEKEQIRDMFASRDMLAFQGQPQDVQAIRELLVSDGYYGSADAFNEHMRLKLIELLSKHFV
jgi:hypothetical protein